MKILGITGSSGAGKTTVCSILKEKYNVYIIDADKTAKELAKKGSSYLKAIVEHFGKEIIDEDGELKRKKLAKLIYENDDKRNTLNELTFQYVVKEIKEEIRRNNNRSIIVIDAPLLFESNLNNICDLVIGIIANEENKIHRICSRDNISEEIAEKRLKIQKNNNYIKEKSDYIIYNNSTIKNLEKEIEEIKLNGKQVFYKD